MVKPKLLRVATSAFLFLPLQAHSLHSPFPPNICQNQYFSNIKYLSALGICHTLFVCLFLARSMCYYSFCLLSRLLPCTHELLFYRRSAQRCIFSGKVPLTPPIFKQLVYREGRIRLMVVSGSIAKDNVQKGMEHTLQLNSPFYEKICSELIIWHLHRLLGLTFILETIKINVMSKLFASQIVINPMGGKQISGISSRGKVGYTFKYVCKA